MKKMQNLLSVAMSNSEAPPKHEPESPKARLFAHLLSVILSLCLSGEALAWNQSYREDELRCDGVTKSCGHQWIVDQALSVLAARGWNHFSTAEAEYLKYGAEFADHPFLGPPEIPDAALPSILDGIIPSDSSGLAWVDAQTSWLGAVDGMVADGWTRTKANPYFLVSYGADALARISLYTKGVAADNQFHFPQGDLNEGVILYPETTAANIQYTVVFDWHSKVSAQRYGATLYQVARAFWPSTPTGPSLAWLPKMAAGHETGRAVLRGTDMNLDVHVWLPSTYLGGNPFLCSGGATPDLCASGTPTWPIFVPETFSLQALTNENPAKSRRAALVYTGWAAHMIEDLGMPWHARNWSGRQHQQFEDLGDDLMVQGALPPSAFDDIAADLEKYWLRSDYCAGIGAGTDTLPLGTAAFFSQPNETPVRQLFDAAQTASSAVVVDASGEPYPWVNQLSDISLFPPSNYVSDSIHRSVRDTVALLACLDGGIYDGIDGVDAAKMMAVLSF